MNIKSLKLILLSLLVSSVGYASVSFSFNVNGFGNASGTPSNGMSVGLLVDTGADGFLAGDYLSFSLSSQFLPTTSGLSNDWFIPVGTTEQGGPPLFGEGSVNEVTGVDFANLAVNQPFGLVWFPSNSANAGDPYGFVTDDTWLMVSDSGTFTNDASVVPGAASLTVVPEPSTYAAVFGLLVLGFAAYRRRIQK